MYNYTMNDQYENIFTKKNTTTYSTTRNIQINTRRARKKTRVVLGGTASVFFRSATK